MHFGKLFASQEAITHSNIINSHYDKDGYCSRADRYIQVSINDNGLGYGFYLLSKNMKSGQTKKTTLSTAGHSMAAIIRRKKNGLYVIKFYDPNTTLRHQRVICKNLKAISQLSINDFLSPQRIKDYFRAFKSILLAEYKSPQAPTPYTPSTEIECYEWSLESATNLLHHALATGKYKSVKKAIAVIHQLAGADQRILFECLLAKSFKGCPGLAMALNNHHSIAVQTYMDLVATAPLTAAYKSELLTAINHENYSALFIAFQYGSTDTITTYMEAIAQSRFISTDKKIEIFLPTRPDGLLGPYIAITQDHYEAAKLYFKQVAKAPFLSDSKKFELITAVIPDNTSFLNNLIYLNNSRAITDYITSITSMEFITDQQLVQLLKAETPTGNNGILTAIIYGHSKALQVYMNAIFDLNSRLTDQQILSLIEVSDSELDLARSKGLHKTVDLYLQLRFTHEPPTYPHYCVIA